MQELREPNAYLERQKGVLQEEMAAFRSMLRNAQSDLRSYLKLPSRFPPGTSERAANFYGETPMRPSPSPEQKVAGFEEYLEECHRQITKFEETLLHFDENISSNNPTNLQKLSEIVTTVQKYLIHETPEVEQIRELVESMKRAHLADEEDERCERATHEVAVVTSLPQSFSYGGEFSLTGPPSNRYAGTSSSSPVSNRTLVPESSLLSAHCTSFPLFTLLSPSRPTFLSASSPASILTSDIFSQSGSGSSSGAACATRPELDIRGGAQIEDLLPPPRGKVDWSYFCARLLPWRPTGIILFSMEESSSSAAYSTHSRPVNHLGRRLLDLLPPPRAEIPQSRSQQQHYLNSQIVQQVPQEQPRHSPIIQELSEANADLERQKGVLQEEMAAFRSMLQNAQSNLRSFMKLPSSFPPGTSGRAANFDGETPMRLSSSIEEKVAGFEGYLEECHRQITKFEGTLLDFDENISSDNPTNLQKLSEIMTTVQKYLIHDTAEVEQICEQVESMKRAHFADVEDERCEQARHEGAAETSLLESFSYGGEFSLTHQPLNRYAFTSSSPFLNRTMVPESSLLSARCALSESLPDLLRSPRSEIRAQSQSQQQQQQQNLNSQMLQQIPEEQSECLISEKGLPWEASLFSDGIVVKSLQEFHSADEVASAHVVIHIQPGTPKSDRDSIEAELARLGKNRQVMGLHSSKSVFKSQSYGVVSTVATSPPPLLFLCR